MIGGRAAVDPRGHVGRIDAGKLRGRGADGLLQRMGRIEVSFQRQIVLHAIRQEAGVFAAAIIVQLIIGFAERRRAPERGIE